MMMLLPIVVGLAIVLQSGLNRVIAETRGLALALMINAVLVALLTGGFLLWVHRAPSAPAFLRGTVGWQWWYFIPALCGFVITLGIPWALSRIGAGAVFALIIATQLLGSLAWDAIVEHRVIGVGKLAAAALTAVGALIFVNL